MRTDPNSKARRPTPEGLLANTSDAEGRALLALPRLLLAAIFNLHDSLKIALAQSEN